ncbi:unnamed protein product [Heligmosomoides polygyrus]|uniref:Uncharacterized protein n=1 Tax=Heligmosomoides polygyrus TaxID=6339 RepID=A0A183GRR9_HELPZ|nr:unnamed protein product [Heligmosomoides polygyrus]
MDTREMESAMWPTRRHYWDSTGFPRTNSSSNVYPRAIFVTCLPQLLTRYAQLSIRLISNSSRQHFLLVWDTAPRRRHVSNSNRMPILSSERHDPFRIPCCLAYHKKSTDLWLPMSSLPSTTPSGPHQLSLFRRRMTRYAFAQTTLRV